MLSGNDGMAFSTRDQDNDKWSDGSCVVVNKVGWWYTACGGTNLNNIDLIYSDHLATVEMKIRPQ